MQRLALKPNFAVRKGVHSTVYVRVTVDLCQKEPHDLHTGHWCALLLVMALSKTEKASRA